MELTSTALVSLACLLSSPHQDPKVVGQLQNELNESQFLAIEEIKASGTCLPDNFEKRIKIEGERPSSFRTSPTTDF